MLPLLQLTLAQKVVLLVSVPVTGMLLYLLLWKRDEDEDEVISRRDVMTSRQTVIEVKVPRDAVGVVIGPQGSNIKEIQEVSGARVNFKDTVSPDTVDRTVVIRGTNDSAQQAELLIRKIVAEQPPTITETIMVLEKALGRIIGKSGDTIRLMSRQSKAKIIVDRSLAKREDGMKEVTLRGTPIAVANAKAMIEEKVEEERAFQAKLAQKSPDKQHQRPPKDTSQLSSSPLKGATDSSKVESILTGQHTEDTHMERAEFLSETADQMKVFVSAIEHPEHFWIQVLGSNSTQLDKMITEMTEYYSKENNLQASQVSDLKVDDIVAAPFANDNNWYRARVIGIQGESIDLYYVDFGDSEILPKDRVKSLRSDFFNLPHQALECKLAGVKPTGDTWSEEAIDVFQELTYCARWKVLLVKTVNYEKASTGETVPCLDMLDPNMAQDVNIADELVKRGFAVYEEQHCKQEEDSSQTAKVTDVKCRTLLPVDDKCQSHLIRGRRYVYDALREKDPALVADFTIPLEDGSYSMLWNPEEISEFRCVPPNLPSSSSHKRAAAAADNQYTEDQSLSMISLREASQFSVLHTGDNLTDSRVTDSGKLLSLQEPSNYLETQHLRPRHLSDIKEPNTIVNRDAVINDVIAHTEATVVSADVNNVFHNAVEVSRDFNDIQTVCNVNNADQMNGAKDLAEAKQKHVYKSYADCLKNKPCFLDRSSDISEYVLEDIPTEEVSMEENDAVEDRISPVDADAYVVKRPVSLGNLSHESSGYDSSSQTCNSPPSMDSSLTVDSPECWNTGTGEDQLQVIQEHLQPVVEPALGCVIRTEENTYIIAECDENPNAALELGEQNKDVRSTDRQDLSVQLDDKAQDFVQVSCEMMVSASSSVMHLSMPQAKTAANVVEDLSHDPFSGSDYLPSSVEEDPESLHVISVSSECPEIPESVWEVTKMKENEMPCLNEGHVAVMAMADEKELDLDESFEESVDDGVGSESAIKLKPNEESDSTDDLQGFYEETIHTDDDLIIIDSSDSDSIASKKKYKKKRLSPSVSSKPHQVDSGLLFVKEAEQLERYHVTRTTLDILNWALKEVEQGDVYGPELTEHPAELNIYETPRPYKKAIDVFELQMVLRDLETEQNFSCSLEARPTTLQEITQVKERAKSRYEMQKETMVLESENEICQSDLDVKQNDNVLGEGHDHSPTPKLVSETETNTLVCSLKPEIAEMSAQNEETCSHPEALSKELKCSDEVQNPEDQEEQSLSHEVNTNEGEEESQLSDEANPVSSDGISSRHTFGSLHYRFLPGVHTPKQGKQKDAESQLSDEGSIEQDRLDKVEQLSDDESCSDVSDSSSDTDHGSITEQQLESVVSAAIGDELGGSTSSVSEKTPNAEAHDVIVNSEGNRAVDSIADVEVEQAEDVLEWMSGQMSYQVECLGPSHSSEHQSGPILVDEKCRENSDHSQDEIVRTTDIADSVCTSLEESTVTAVKFDKDPPLKMATHESCDFDTNILDDASDVLPKTPTETHDVSPENKGPPIPKGKRQNMSKMTGEIEQSTPVVVPITESTLNHPESLHLQGAHVDIYQLHPATLSDEEISDNNTETSSVKLTDKGPMEPKSTVTSPPLPEIFVYSPTDSESSYFQKEPSVDLDSDVRIADGFQLANEATEDCLDEKPDLEKEAGAESVDLDDYFIIDLPNEKSDNDQKEEKPAEDKPQEYVPVSDSVKQEEKPLTEDKPQEDMPVSDIVKQEEKDQPQEDVPVSDSVKQEEKLTEGKAQEDVPVSDSVKQEEKLVEDKPLEDMPVSDIVKQEEKDQPQEDVPVSDSVKQEEERASTGRCACVNSVKQEEKLRKKAAQEDCLCLSV
ncbi:hypothetical protein LSH36_25g07051 [Paralvinella palmiformis]|uniref:Tudor domain-containing protein n=1 Tax=Paralvinella palmiformis TaxID=53620 RepID=A0AAD9NGR7_9ANNE|nr:hypothetical protein LSH36_25g07051 [Paralvinella palmiformis]